MMIDATSTGRRQKPSVTTLCEMRLRGDALAAEPGALLGSEDALMARYQVSRPTLRQAAARVAREQLVLVRRGVGGGYFATQPTERAVSNMAAIFLRTRRAGLSDILRSVAPLHIEMARLAAIHADEHDRSALQSFLVDDERLEQGAFGFREYLRNSRQFERLLGNACHNPVLALFLQILIDLAGTLRPQEDLFIGRPQRVHEFRSRRRRVAQAILEGDPDLAVLTARRWSDVSYAWMQMDRVGHDVDASDERGAALPDPVQPPAAT
jgi:DNA-binding FadR family transcriptional regulator